MKIKEIMVAGFRPALRGMRNPKESWALSDTTFGGVFQPEGIDCPSAPTSAPRISSSRVSSSRPAPITASSCARS